MPDEVTTNDTMAEYPDTANAAEVQDEATSGDPPLTEREIKRNMFSIITLDAIYGTGSTDFSVALTPLMSTLGASNALFGTMNGLQWLALPGTFISPWITRRFFAKKWYFFWTNVPSNFCIGLIGGVLLFSSYLHLSHPWLLGFVFSMVAAWWFLSGFVGLPAAEYIAGTIPMSHRGRYTGLSAMLGSATGIGMAWFARWILKHYPTGTMLPYGVLFMSAYILMQSSFFVALLAKERKVPKEKSPKAWSKSMLKVAWENKPWLRVLLVYGLSYLLIAPMWNFVPYYGLNGLHMPVWTSAIIMIILKVGGILVFPIVGFVADRFSAKRILPYWPMIVALAILPLLLLHNAYGVYITVAIQSFAGAASSVSFTVLLYGLPKPEHRAGHFTLQSIVLYVAGFVGNTGLGMAMDKLHYIPVFCGIFVIAILLIPVTKWVVAPLSSDPKAYG